MRAVKLITAFINVVLGNALLWLLAADLGVAFFLSVNMLALLMLWKSFAWIKPGWHVAQLLALAVVGVLSVPLLGGALGFFGHEIMQLPAGSATLSGVVELFLKSLIGGILGILFFGLFIWPLAIINSIAFCFYCGELRERTPPGVPSTFE